MRKGCAFPLPGTTHQPHPRHRRQSLRGGADEEKTWANGPERQSLSAEQGAKPLPFPRSIHDKKSPDSCNMREGLYKVPLHSAKSCKNVVILGRQSVIILFVFIHITASNVIFIIFFSEPGPRATCRPEIRQFASLHWKVCHGFFASVWAFVKPSRQRCGGCPVPRRLPLSKATLEPSLLSRNSVPIFPEAGRDFAIPG
jgi:hypothetical protein